AVCVIDRDRPEAVDWHLPNGDLVLALGKPGLDREIPRLSVRKPAPAGRGRDEVANRVDIALRSERVVEASDVSGEFEQRLASRVEGVAVVVGGLERV